jgi:glycosyltransferase involved in cell wall biosynthesis
MRVGVNASVLSGRVTGVGTYLVQLLRAFAKLPPGGSPEFVVFGTKDGSLVPCARHFSWVPTPKLAGPRRVLWEQLTLPKLCRSYGIDVLHCPDFARPFTSPVPVVNTIHDLSYYAAENYFPIAKRLYKKALCRVAIEKSSVLIADSEFTKQEILAHFGIEPSRVIVSLLGGPEADVAQRQKTEPPFLLFVGTLEKRKNVANLVNAYGSVRKQGLPHRLVLVGHPGYGWREIECAIQRNPFKADIDIRGYLCSSEVNELYRSAELFVFPSHHEGFGLPVLEAMAAGCPVVCSRAGSLPEVAGDGAEYTDSRTVEGLAAGLISVLSSRSRLEELVTMGKRRVSQFSWDRCAETHLAAFRKAAGAVQASDEPGAVVQFQHSTPSTHVTRRV